MSAERDNKIRICMMLPKFHIGGAEMQVLGLLRNLDRSRFAVSLCLFNRGDARMEDEAARHVDSIYYLGFRWRNLPVSFLRLVKYLQDGRFDVLHAHLAWADLIGRIAAWFAGVPVRVTTEHGKNLWKSKALLRLERSLNAITDAKVCVSRDIIDIRRRNEKTPEEKLLYIPNAVDPGEFTGRNGDKYRLMEEFGWSGDDPLVLSLGRVVEAKNYPLLVEAFEMLLRDFPRAKCVIAGDGPMREEVAARIKELGLAGSVALPGARRDTAELLAAADLFVLSSVREGLPVSLLEAMAAGTPVVTTDVGGVGDAVRDGENGLLVPSGDAAALAGAMRRILADPDLASAITAEASMTVVERFSMKSAADRLTGIYLELLGKKSPSRTGGAV